MKPCHISSKHSKFSRQNDLNSIAVVYSQIGHYLIKGGEEESGLNFLQRSVKINKETGNRHSLAYVLIEVAVIELSRGELDQAFEHLLLCEEIFNETGDLNMLSQTYDGFSQYYEKRAIIKKH